MSEPWHRKEKEMTWEEEARLYAQNADYWRENYYKARALLIAAFEGTGHPEATQVKAINEEYQEFLEKCPRIPQHA